MTLNHFGISLHIDTHILYPDIVTLRNNIRIDYMEGCVVKPISAFTDKDL